MTIDTSSRGGVTIATLHGDSLETGNVAVFRRAIAPVTERHTKVVMDLSEVTFMDSTGLGAMLSSLRTLKAKGGELRLANLSAEVAQLFEMVMMDRVFEIYPNVDEAVAAFGTK